MDTQRDFKPFQELLDELCAALREGYKASDALVRAYWDALKDVHLSEIRANAKRIIASATKETRFPLPHDLRNRPAVVDRPADAKREAAERLSLESWKEMRAQDPVSYRIEISLALAARELASLAKGDPGYDEWTNEYQRWAGIRYAPREKQEAAIRRWLPEQTS